MSLLWEPIHIPSAGALDIPDDEFKRIEIQSRDGVKPHIEQYQCPLVERIYCVGYSVSEICMRTILPTNHSDTYLQGPYGPCAE